MINSAHIQNFKLFQNQSLEFSNLNLLTGLNGMGKSTLIQTLLLLRDTFFKDTIEKQLNLSKQDFNNVLFDAGKVKDVRSVNSDVTNILFKFIFDKKEYFWEYDAKKDAEKKLSVISTNTNQNELKEYALFNEHFCYLSAERIVPKNEYNKSSESEQKVNKFGNTGEYALNFLLENPKNEVYLKHPSEPRNDLESQVNAWLGEISPKISYRIAPIKNTNKLHLDYSFGNSNTHFDPSNVGFGITYVLPIIISLLSAKAGDLLIIENPESHLHPKGQSKLAELMCLAAQNGVQIFCETHSDHIVNGALVSVYEHYKDKRDGKEKLRGISHENINISFFGRSATEYTSEVTQIPISEKGRIKNAPKDFFDQIDIDLRRMI